MQHINLKISVITVCYNPGDKIIATIQSVLSQTYSNIQYIIVDGASTDGTVEILNSYRSKIHLVISEPDNGLYEAMNKGIRRATGDLIIFLNAGDIYISSTVIEYAIGKINIHKADVFFARFIWESPLTRDIVLSDHNWVNYDWDLKRSNFPHPATFYKANVFEKVGTFNESFSIMADYEWNVRALVKHRVAFQYVNIISAKFTADGISNSQSNMLTMQMEIDIIAEQYYHPFWLFNFVDRYLNKKNDFVEFGKKVLAKIYQKRLNRVY